MSIDVEARPSSAPPEAAQEPKRVLILSHMYPREHHPFGGIFVHEQVKALRASGIDARVLSGEPFWINCLNPLQIARSVRAYLKTRSNQWTSFEGVPLIRFPYVVSSRFLPFQAHAFTYCNGVSRCLADLGNTFEFELVHAHTSFTDGSAGAMVSATHGIPLVITEHTGPFTTLTRTRYLRRKTQRAINSAHALLAVSNSLLSDIKREIALAKPERASVLANTVDTTLFQPSPRRPGRKVRILWVGHFVPVKRVDVLLKALWSARKSREDLHLTLVGTGELESGLRQLVADLDMQDCVEFAGGAERSKLPAYYSETDFLAIASETETFGVVAIEAMSCGRPVLTTNCGGPAEIVDSDTVGMVVGKSEEELAAGLLEMAARVRLSDPDKIRKKAEERYSTHAVVGKLKKVYSRALKEGRH